MGKKLQGVTLVAKSDKVGGFDKWEVDNWARTLEDAAGIISDPKKMAAVSKKLSERKKAIKTLEGLKAYANKLDR